jgi:hypothetical protein
LGEHSLWTRFASTRHWSVNITAMRVSPYDNIIPITHLREYRIGVRHPFRFSKLYVKSQLNRTKFVIGLIIISLSAMQRWWDACTILRTERWGEWCIAGNGHLIQWVIYLGNSVRYSCSSFASQCKKNHD